MSFVTTEIQDAVAVLTIDRPKALNALNPEVLADLKAAFEAIDQNTVRCVVLPVPVTRASWPVPTLALCPR